jgi:predicted enzyme related to lactoylglutathione lyase
VAYLYLVRPTSTLHAQSKNAYFMKVVEIAFSCYPVTDMHRARAFYEGVLRLTATMDAQFEGAHWVEYDIGAGTLAIGVTPGMSPCQDGCSVSLEVEDFDKAISELQAAGVPFKFSPLETPVCQMAWVRDPDGNLVGIHKRKPGHH